MTTLNETVCDLTEAELIARIQQRLPPAPGWMLVGIGDDAAVVEPERNRVEVLTVDSIVEGVHFDRAFVPPDAIADGFCALAAKHRVHLAGGNLTRSPGPLTIDVTVVGTVKRRQALTRGGARAGEELYVSGTIGAARAGLHLLREVASHQSPVASRDWGLETGRLATAYLRPDPRVRLGLWLGRNRIAGACIDLSDGLSDGVHRIAEASGVGIAVDADALPIADDTRRVFDQRGLDVVDAAVSAGDDYELLFTVKRRMGRALAAGARRVGVGITRIGVCTGDAGVVLRRGGVDTAMPAAAYRHFGAAPASASRE